MPLGLTDNQWQRFRNLNLEDQRELIAAMTPADALTFDADFEAWAHENQLPPNGDGWRTWLMMAGRGFGKTRAGAEWIHRLALVGGRRIALVGASMDEGRKVMIEGVSGLLAIGRNCRVKLKWEPSLNQLRWPGGSVATLYSGDSPDGMRGPEHHFAWLLTFEVEADEADVSLARLLGDASGGLIDAEGERPIPGFAAHGSSIGDSLTGLINLCGVELVDRGGSLMSAAAGPPTLLSPDELGCDPDGETRHRTERVKAPDSALPSRLALTYYDPDRDYQTGQMRASSGSGGAREERVELPAVLTAEQAKQLVEQALARRWRNGDQLRLSLPPSRMNLRPGDAIQLADEARAWMIRAVSIEGMAVSIEAEAAPVTVPALPADSGRAVSEADLPIGRTELALFELPALGDAPGTAVTAYVAAANAGRWKPVPVELALGNDPLAGVAVTRRAVLGRAETVLEARAPLVLDQLSAVIVRLANPAQILLNADWDGLMAGANLAAVGDELIQFGRAEQLEPGMFRLSSLLRGRRGTEWAAMGHAISEPFCMIDPAAMRPVEVAASATGALLAATAHGIGDSAPLPASQRVLSGESLRPPSPCHPKLWRQGEIVRAQWIRRSHRGWSWIDGVDVAADPFPELYRLTVTGPAGQLITETGATSATFDIAELPGQSGQQVELSVAMVGPMAPSREASAILIL